MAKVGRKVDIIWGMCVFQQLNIIASTGGSSGIIEGIHSISSDFDWYWSPMCANVCPSGVVII